MSIPALIVKSLGKRFCILVCLVFGLVGPFAVTFAYEGVKNYYNYGRWSQKDVWKIVRPDGTVEEKVVPIMIDYWGPTSWTSVAPYILIFVTCPLLGGWGIWVLSRRLE